MLIAIAISFQIAIAMAKIEKMATNKTYLISCDTKIEN